MNTNNKATTPAEQAPSEPVAPFGYFHELLDHEGKGDGIWLGTYSEQVTRAAAIEGETGTEVIALYLHPTHASHADEAAKVPEGWQLIAVSGFDELMYWLDRCDNKGHLDNCADLIEPWANFKYEYVPAAPVPPAEVKAQADKAFIPECENINKSWRDAP